jgi:lipopolysaccharide biosynthesis glycosyltransferase
VNPRDTLVFFATDPGYAFPAIAAIRAFRANGGCDELDVALLAIDFSDEALGRLQGVLAPSRVTVTPLKSRTFVPEGVRVESEDVVFKYLSLAALGRLVAWRHIPAHYTHALYIDADTWCVGDMRPLVDSMPHSGKLHAVPDPVHYVRGHIGNVGAAARRYVAGIGVPPDVTYFSSGVLWGEVSAWKVLGEEALAYYFAHQKVCHLMDQSALNAIARGRLTPMSQRWNASSQLRLWGAEQFLTPRLSHFTGPGKPWLGPVAPWEDFALRFDSLRADPAIAAFAPPKASPERVAQLHRRPVHGSLKAVTLDRIREARIRLEIRAYERAVPF